MLQLLKIKLLTFLLISYNLNSQEHYFHADLNVSNSGKQIVLKSSLSFGNPVGSKISHSSLSTLNPDNNNIILHEGEILEDYDMEFIIESKVENNFEIGLFEQSSLDDIKYSISFESDLAKVQSPNFELDLGEYNVDDIFRIMKCGPLVLFYKNNNLIIKRKILNSYNSFDGVVNLINANDTEVFTTFELLDECDYLDNNEYLVPKSSLSGDFYEVNGSTLNIYFLEKYAHSDLAKWSIKFVDASSNLVEIEGDYMPKYGSNHINIDISALASGEIYLFELVGQNKNERKYLTFKKI